MLSDKVRRIKNMVWTVSDKYETEVDVKGDQSFTDTEKVTISSDEVMIKAGVSEEDAYNSNLYAAAHEGSHMIHSDMETLKKYMAKMAKKGADLEVANGLMQVAEDYRVDSLSTDVRPGYQDLREGSVKSIAQLFADRPSGDKNFDTIKAISALTYGLDMRTISKKWKDLDLDWDMIESSAEELMDYISDNLYDKESAPNVAEQLYNKHYKYSKSEEDEDTNPESSEPDKECDDNENVEGDSDKKPTAGGSEYHFDEDEDKEGEEEDESSEHSDDNTADGSDSGESDDTDGEVDDDATDGSGESKDSGDTPLDDVISDMVKKGLEKSPIEEFMDEDSKRDLERVKEEVEDEKNTEKSLAVSQWTRWKEMESGETLPYYIKNVNLLWSEQEHREVVSRICRGLHAGATVMYFESERRTHAKFDRAEFPDIILDHAKNEGRKLANKLKQDLRAAKEREAYVSDNGEVIASQCWRATKTNSSRIFKKHDYTEVGNYVVDLVLDASGSQSGRVRDIRLQAYTIRHAFSILGIPCRVTQFNVHYNVNTVERLVDYDDPQEKDIGALNYYATDNNRDDLSYLTVYEELKKRPEENKIMLVLSDGAPADNSGADVIRAHGGMGTYVGSRAVRECSKVIRDLRKKISVVGVYVGSGDYLEYEKTMFGNDFAYIRNMDIFSDVVYSKIRKEINR
jgi:cobalamin biosynthesis protein CobT